MRAHPTRMHSPFKFNENLVEKASLDGAESKEEPGKRNGCNFPLRSRMELNHVIPRTTGIPIVDATGAIPIATGSISPRRKALDVIMGLEENKINKLGISRTYGPACSWSRTRRSRLRQGSVLRCYGSDTNRLWISFLGG